LPYKKIVKVLITGVPCTGKTSLARAWSSHTGCPILSLNDLVEQKKLYTHVDEEDFAKVVKLPALHRAANSWLSSQKESCIVESHLGCEVKLGVDKVIVLRLNPAELQRRLASRGYVPAKIAANKMSELLDYCTVLSMQNYGEKKLYEIDMTGREKAEQSFEDLGDIIAGVSAAEKLRPRISWSAQLLEEVSK